jgi:hypothetical protein
MQLEQIAVTLRPRTGWEAIDLGYAMVQAWWRPILRVWSVTYVPVALIVNLACWFEPVYAVMIMWWLKPAFDRVVLHVLSNAAFGEMPGVADTLRALPRLWWNNRLLAALTYARLSPVRSFHLPVTQLEASRGKAARNRMRVLGREGRSPAVWLTVVSVHLEVTLYLCVCLLINLLSPGEPLFQFSWQAIFNPQSSHAVQYLSNGINTIVITVLEPLYVAAGFSLYLNCRTALEGWDVELTFKRLAARIDEQQQKMRRLGAAAASCVLTLALGLAMPPEARAQSCPIPDAATNPAAGAANDDEPEEPTEPAKSGAPDTGARQRIAKVLADPVFGEEKPAWRLRYVGPNWWGAERSKPNDWSTLSKIVEYLAKGFRVVVWIAGAILLIGLSYLLIRYVRRSRRSTAPASSLPDMLFGLDVRPESIPDDLAAAVSALLAAGDMRAAIGLLYRAALVSLLQEGRIDIQPGDTEGDCERRVQRAYVQGADETGKAEFFIRLVRSWQQVAYAHRMPAHDTVQVLAAEWTRHFRVPGPAPVRTSLSEAA